MKIRPKRQNDPGQTERRTDDDLTIRSGPEKEPVVENIENNKQRKNDRHTT